MIVKKITTGFVVQEYNTETKQFTSQEFVASDDVTWEDETEHVFNAKEKDSLGLGNVDTTEPYLNFEMTQPPIWETPKISPLVANPFSFKVGEQVLVTPLEGPSSFLDYERITHEFMGKVIGIHANKYVMVKDQDGDVFDCEPVQVHHVRE